MENELKAPKFKIGQEVWVAKWETDKYVPTSFIVRTITGYGPNFDEHKYGSSNIPGSASWEELEIRDTEEAARKLAEEKNLIDKLYDEKEHLKWTKGRVEYLQQALKDMPNELTERLEDIKKSEKRLERLKKKYKEVFGVLFA